MTPKNKWLLSLIFALVTLLIMQWQGSALQSFITPLGIVALELANTKVILQQLLMLWDASTVRMNIWLDFLFIPAYTFFFISSLHIIIKNHKNNFLLIIGEKLVLLAYLALALDVVENILMLFSISGNYSNLSLQATASIATGKFVAIGLILTYLIFSLPVIFFNQRKS